MQARHPSTAEEPNGPHGQCAAGAVKQHPAQATAKAPTGADQGRWHDVIDLSEQVLYAAPQHMEARRARESCLYITGHRHCNRLVRDVLRRS